VNRSVWVSAGLGITAAVGAIGGVVALANGARTRGADRIGVLMIATGLHIPLDLDDRSPTRRIGR